MLVSLIVNFAIPLALICYLFLRHRFSYWRNKGVSSTSPRGPLGDLFGIGFKQHICTKQQELYGRFKRSGFGGFFSTIVPVFMPTDLELIKSILIKDFNFFTDRNFYNNEKDDPLSVNLLTLEGERWKRRRQLLTPIFTSGKLKNMFHLVVKKSSDLVDAADQSIKTGVPLNTKKFTRDFTLQAIASCAFGIDLDKNTEQIQKLNELVIGTASPFGFIKFIVSANFPEFARGLGVQFLDQNVVRFVLDMIPATAKYREETGIHKNDLLDLLLEIKREQKIGDVEEFDITRVAAESLLFFVGGFETSAATMSWAIFELARNPKYQERLRAEIREFKEKHGGQLSYEAIAEMNYLNQIFQETLRLYPPFPTNFRKSVADYKIPNTDIVLEKGTVVWIPAYAIQRDPDIFPNPDVFNPENFAPEAVQNRSSLTFLAFGDGPRNCVGMRFAQLQTKIGIATVIDNFRVIVNSKTQLPIELDLKSPVSPANKGGLWVNFERVE